ncbi:MAG: CpsD/CapB family tyrosine-protein kinase [Sarcina sp.]
MFVVEKQPKSIVSETYRTLRTNIQYSSFDEELKTLVITSSKPQEGKSLTAGNLALSLAQDNKKVILVDCDLRKPSIHKNFSLSNKDGLTEVILGRKDVDEVVTEYKPMLHILTAGKVPPNPSEMLGSETMKILIEDLKERYDYVIIDTPPVLAVTDSQILSTIADGVLFVVRAGHTKKEQVIHAKNELDKVKAPLIGTVLNDLDIKNSDYYYYYSDDDGNGKKKKKGRH